MADEVLDGASPDVAEVTAVPDLRSTIVDAVEKQRSNVQIDLPRQEDGSFGDKPEAKADAPTETEAERNERLRDKTGKFATEKNAVRSPSKAAPTRDQIHAKAAQLAEAAGKVIDIEGYDDYLAAAKAALVNGDAAPKVAEHQEAPASDQPAIRPPPGWSPAAKVAFDNLPAEVKQAVAQREIEVNKGFEKLSAYKPIDRYMDMARQSGTTLDKALEAYVGIETKLRQDFPGGILELCQRQGVNPTALAQHILSRNGAAPSNGQAGTDTQVRQQAPSVDPATVQRIAALENFIQQQQSSTVQTEIQRFASDPKNTFFENVKTQMGQLINSGQAEDLEDAYDKACWANKEIRALLIKQQAPAPSANAADAVSKAKAAAKATGGAPSAGFKPNAGTAGADIRSTIVAAVNAQRGL